MVNKYKEISGDSSIKVEHNEKRGYFFSFSKSTNIKNMQVLLGQKLIKTVLVFFITEI